MVFSVRPSRPTDDRYDGCHYWCVGGWVVVGWLLFLVQFDNLIIRAHNL